MNKKYANSFAYQFNPVRRMDLKKGLYSRLDQLMEEGAPFWLQVEKPSKNFQQQFSKKCHIPRTAKSFLFSEDTRSKFAKMDHGFLLVLNGIDSLSMKGPEDFPTMRFWITQDTIFSFSSGPIKAVREVQKLIDEGDSSELISALSLILECFVDNLEDAIYRIDEDLNRIESNFEYTHESIQKIMVIRQDIIFLRRFALPQRDALIAFCNKFEFSSELLRAHAKETSDKMIRQVEYIEMLRERAVIIQDNITNQIGDIANKRMYILTIIMLIFTPAFFIIGIFSMYLPIPGMYSKWTWWLVDASIVLISYGLYKLFKINKWL